jgi:hypothetical protein
MRHLTVRVVLVGIVGLVSASSSVFAGRQSQPKSHLVQPETVRGCYELSLSDWRPKMDLGDDAPFVTPPHRIELSAERGTHGWEAEGFLVKPAPGIEPKIDIHSYWLPKSARSIEIVWTTGFSGVTMALTIQGSDMQGQAQTFWDFTRDRQQADVVARRVKCGDATISTVAPTNESGCKIADGQPTISAGHGWGAVHIGAASSEVDAFLGARESSRKYSNVHVEEFRTKGIEVGFENDSGAVHNIYFFNHQWESPEFAAFCGKLDSGVDWQSSVDDVKKAYGVPISDFKGTDPSGTWERLVFTGIDFRFENEKMVRIGIPGN